MLAVPTIERIGNSCNTNSMVFISALATYEYDSCILLLDRFRPDMEAPEKAGADADGSAAGGEAEDRPVTERRHHRLRAGELLSLRRDLSTEAKYVQVSVIGPS